MTEYGILIETRDGVRTRRWLPYANDAAVIADWQHHGAAGLVEIVAEGRVIARWDGRQADAA
ncbi:MAG TPA: hypothetical protein VH331_17600 [Allosphingosinicella sp.]|jgi:hypothetical protein|nr:hypothetical protein [Allosphingosinicella sp.]